MSLDFGEGVDSVKITVLSNNTIDVTLPTDSRFKGKVIQPTISVVNAIAEHGLAMSIEVNGTNILYDFGGMGLAIIKNLEILKVNPKIFQKAVLSHGHFDHFGTIFKLLPLMGPANIIIDPNIYEQKIGVLGETIVTIDVLKENYRDLKKTKKIRELPGLRKNLLEKFTTDNQQTLIETTQPIELAPGVWTSGEIELLDKSELTTNLFIKIDKTTFKEETFRDEIAIYIKVKDKGLVVLTGCGHNGIINTIKHGQKLSGVDKIYAVIGGFHLNWSTEKHLDKVVNYFKELKPEIICGMHCTGFRFNSKLIPKMPDNATLGLVGTKYIL
ncbi:MAG: MBL fold metallo-hydrolase [Candidatus Hodarchaeota archaeon]